MVCHFTQNELNRERNSVTSHYYSSQLCGAGSLPLFLRAATVSYRGVWNKHYIISIQTGKAKKSRVGTTKALFQYSNLEVLKILTQWGQNNQRVERDGFWFSHNVTKSLSDMLMHCNAGCEKPCINWDKVACKEHADFFLYLMSECWKRFYSSA